MHFSSVHANNYSAWKYVTKKDKHPLESKGHSDLTNSEGPSTMKTSEALCNGGMKRCYRENEDAKDTEIWDSDESGESQK